MNHKSLDAHKISTEGIDLSQAAHLYQEFFNTCEYNWWYEVLPDDVVVDIGGCVGFFSALALDKGAEKVYMIEPNRNLVKTAIRNVSDHIIDDPTRFVPIHGAMSESASDTLHVFGENQGYPTFTFSEFLEKYDVKNIDFLKVDCEGAEYNILKPQMIDFFENNVRHMAIEVHLRAQDDSPTKFIQWRDSFLQHFAGKGKVRYQSKYVADAVNEDWSIMQRDFTKVPAEFMVYITNW